MADINILIGSAKNYPLESDNSFPTGNASFQNQNACIVMPKEEDSILCYTSRQCKCQQI